MNAGSENQPNMCEEKILKLYRAELQNTQLRTRESVKRILRYTHKTSGFKMSGFKTSGFKTSGLQNVRFTKRQVSKRLVSKCPVFKFDILIKQKGEELPS